MAYLAELLLQASRWERSEGEVLSGLELEVQDRIRRLSGINTVDDNGRVQSDLKKLVNKLGVAKQPTKVPSLKHWRYLHRAELANQPEGVVLAKYHEAVKPSQDTQEIAEVV